MSSLPPRSTLIRSLLAAPVATDAALFRAGQAFCHGAAALIPYLAFNQFANLELPEVPLLLGVLGTMLVSVGYTILGVLLHLKARTA